MTRALPHARRDSSSPIPESLELVGSLPCVPSFIASLDLAALNPFDLVSSECVRSDFAKYQQRVHSSVLGFSVICFVIYEMYAINSCFAKEENRPRIHSDYMTAFLGFAHALYPTMSLLQLRGFQVSSAVE